MNLERMKQLAGVKLNESVSAVPGIGNTLEEKSKSEKQARFMAAAAHNPEFAKKTGMDSDVAKEFNKADTGTEQLSKAMKHKTNEEVKKSDIPAAQRKAQGGDWKVSTKDLEKENPTNKEFMANRAKEVGLKEDDVMGEMSMMEDDGIENIIAQKMQRLRDLSASFVDNQEAFDVIVRELSEEGYDADVIDEIMDALHADVYGTEPSDGMTDMEADADALASAGFGTDEDYGDYGSDDGMYEEDTVFNNGYGTEECADGDDFFPDGADSPVVNKVGPSGARQGDNPEQKKMQVAEVHKELVYSYRNFLNESENQKKKLNESDLKLIHVKRIMDSGNGPESDDLFTATDGQGNYPLATDGSVFFTADKDSPHLNELDGAPHSLGKVLFLFDVNGKLGLYDENLKLVQSYGSLDEFLEDTENSTTFGSYTLDYHG